MNVPVFLNVLAWIFAVVSLVTIIFKVWCFWRYQSSIQRNLDHILSVERTWPIHWWCLVLIVCVAWLIASRS